MSEPARIVWLASYPKCGNTWVRFMLYAALHGPPREPIEVARAIPDIHRPMPFDKPPSGRVIVKSHFMLTDRHPRLDETDRAIHVIRNPRDVVLSALHYRRLAGQGVKAFTQAGYVKSFIRSGGDPDWASQGFGTWASHAESWLNTDRFPVLGVRYEDLKTDPRTQLARILDFLGESVGDERIDEAVRASSFESMRALEVREKQKPMPAKEARSKRLFVGDTKAARKGVFFINKGRSGQSLDAVGRGLDEAFGRAFGDAMARLGYEGS